MSTHFADWKTAHTFAQETANHTGDDVAIRKASDGFNVNLASRNDSDYDTAEIVKPVPVKKVSGLAFTKPYHVAGGLWFNVKADPNAPKIPVYLEHVAKTLLNDMANPKSETGEALRNGETVSIETNCVFA